MMKIRFRKIHKIQREDRIKIIKSQINQLK